MLPGLRFLFAAVVLSMSVLVFGLGAASLLRASHDRFVSTPKIRSAPPPMYAQHSEPAVPALAMLRVEAPASVPDTAIDTATLGSVSPETPSPADSSPPTVEIALSSPTAGTDAVAALVAPAAEADVAAGSPPRPSADTPSITVAAAPAATAPPTPQSADPVAIAEPSQPATDQSAAPPVAAATDAEPTMEVAAVSEALPETPKLPTARPVIKKKKHATVHRVVKKRRHIVRRRAPAAEQPFGASATGG